MKNIHRINGNIYITNDEEIKEGNWFLHPFNTIHKAGGNLIDKDFKKIILTTDQDLIKDGVQAIDDEFLEWFVKNPSCEWVKVVDYPMVEKYNSRGEYIHHNYWTYKIIIPKQEEQKQHLIDMMRSDEELGLYDEQNKNLYSEEDMKQFGLYLGDNLKKLRGKTIDKIFEQFKNK